MQPGAPSRFLRNSGGNRLEASAVVAQGTGHALWLRGPSEAVAQVQAVDPSYQLLVVPATEAHWTHHLFSPLSDRPTPEVAELLDVIGSVITLPSRPNLDFALCLDWYKVLEAGVSGDKWSNTAIGELVTKGKYWYMADPERQRTVGREIVAQLVAVVGAHPLLRAADVVVDVPGHDQARVSFGGRVAATVARDTTKALTRLSCVDPFRAEAKSLETWERQTALADKFRCPDVEGLTVLVVDDVYSSGSSMSEAARAARAAGAERVFGLSAVRTMRR